jgi:enoyl-CoA hydratase
MAFQRSWSDIVLRMRRCPQPIVSLLHGPASGLGFALALASDIRIAGESTRMNAAFIRIGLSGGDCGSSYHLPRLVGGGIASELLLTGRFIDAERALRIGLVSEVVPDGELEKAGKAVVADILRNAPLGVRLTKDMLNASQSTTSLDQHVALEDRSQVLTLSTGDPGEGARAFLEKRDPNYAD